METKSIKVILVDNDTDELFFMEKGFRSSHLYTIIGQCSGWHELLKLLGTITELPDLIVSDLNMPGKNGNEIAAAIAEHPLYNSIKVVVLSISAGNKEIERPSGPDGKSFFLPKPS